MKHEQPEVLVIMDEAATTDLRSRVTVTQTFPPRIYVVEAAAAVSHQLRQAPGVIGVLEQTATLPQLPLTEGERLFVLAWLSQSKTKTRQGEGLAWDDPHFQPPA